VTGRKCGDCTLCCRLLPVVDLGKNAGQRCDHQRSGKGCMIYANRPPSCVHWSCKWLVNDGTAGLPRPDRAHYVIDIMPDYVTMTPEGGDPIRIPVQQVWVDPQHRDAWRTPELREQMARLAATDGMATIIRWSSSDALTVFPPAMNSDNEWHELSGQIKARNDMERKIFSNMLTAEMEA
jgi:hypothetical protein